MVVYLPAFDPFTKRFAWSDEPCWRCVRGWRRGEAVQADAHRGVDRTKKELKLIGAPVKKWQIIVLSHIHTWTISQKKIWASTHAWSNKRQQLSKLLDQIIDERCQRVLLLAIFKHSLQWYFSQKLGILLILKVPGSNERAPSLQVLRRVRLSAVHGQVWHPGHVVAQWPAHVDLDGLAGGVGTASATPISQGQERGRDHQDGGHHLTRPRGNHCAPNPSAGSPSDVWELHFNFSSFFHSSYCCFTFNNFCRII